MKNFLPRLQKAHSRFLFLRNPEGPETPTGAVTPERIPNPEAAAAAIGAHGVDVTAAVNRLPGSGEARAIAANIEARLNIDDAFANLSATLEAFSQTDLNDPNNPNLFSMFMGLLEDFGIDLNDPEDNTAGNTGPTSGSARSSGVDGPPPEGANLTSEELADVAATRESLAAGGVTLHSTAMGAAEDGTSRERDRTCLIGLRESSLSGALALRQAAGADLVCTGGTEDGHAPGPMSHGEGYKLDFSVSSALVNLTGLTGMDQSRTMTIGGQRMDFLRHGPADHFDVKIYPA